MAMPESAREACRERPCPYRIVDRTGDTFVLGTVVGSAFSLIKGIYNSPPGFRLSGGAQAVWKNAPRHGGMLAAYGGTIATLECAMVYDRQKDDSWNAILSATATGILRSVPQGLRASARGAAIGCLVMTFCEGAYLHINRARRKERITCGRVKSLVSETSSA